MPRFCSHPKISQHPYKLIYKDGSIHYKHKCYICGRPVGDSVPKKSNRTPSKAYQKFLSSKQWQRKREEVIERANGKCEICRVNDIEDVHHLRYSIWGEEPLEDLIGVCGDCHATEHDIEKQTLEALRAKLLSTTC